jgi:hypothetical protein
MGRGHDDKAERVAGEEAQVLKDGASGSGNGDGSDKQYYGGGGYPYGGYSRYGYPSYYC